MKKKNLFVVLIVVLIIVALDGCVRPEPVSPAILDALPFPDTTPVPVDMSVAFPARLELVETENPNMGKYVSAVVVCDEIKMRTLFPISDGDCLREQAECGDSYGESPIISRDCMRPCWEPSTSIKVRANLL